MMNVLQMLATMEPQRRIEFVQQQVTQMPAGAQVRIRSNTIHAPRNMAVPCLVELGPSCHSPHPACLV